ncbi:MAG: oligosaccharide flippase family protein [Dysgonamonadaceae bacterium]|nr:oligosaccharide flippase family protein [Dysgonamonadaceae bacterium]
MIKFLKQFFIYGFASILGKIAAVFLLPLYTNVLTKEEYGAMALITAAKGIIDLFSNLNIHSGIARDYHERGVNRTKLVSTGFISILLCSIVVFFILLISRDFWIGSVLNIQDYEKAFIIMLFTLPAGSLFSYFGILTRYKNRAVAFSIGNIVQLFVQISLTIYFVLVLKIGVQGVFYGILGGEIIGIVFFYFINKENIRITFDKNILKRALMFSLPTLPAIVAVWIDSSLGQVLIGKFISVEEAGVYSIALRLSSVFLLFQIAFNNVWKPFVYENYKKENFKKDTMRIFKLSALMLLLISLNLSMLSDYIVLLLSNITYLQASKYLIILCIPMSLAILQLFVEIGPGIVRKTKYLSYSNITGSAFNLIFLFIFLPKLGVITVPISLSVSKLINYAIISYFTNKQIDFAFPKKYVLFLIIIVAISFTFKTYDISLTNTIILLFVINLFTVIYLYRYYNLSVVLKKYIGKKS